MFGPGGISPGSLILILLIVLLLFGTKRLRSIGSDLGQALKGFRKGLVEEEPARLEAEEQPAAKSTTPEPAASDKKA